MTPFFCYKRNLKAQTTVCLSKKEPIKKIEETEHAVLSEDNGELHEKLNCRPTFYHDYTLRGNGPRDSKLVADSTKRLLKPASRTAGNTGI